MQQAFTLQSLFKRYRQPGDIIFAWFALLASAFLLVQLADQTAWRSGGKLFAQPRFWPALSLGGMFVFAALHLLSSALSQRIHGRWQELRLWFGSLEYVLWFIAYAASVPIVGYLPATTVFALVLSYRVGYRKPSALLAAVICAFIIVLLFKTLLKVNLPAGQLYERLPNGLRQIMLNYF